MELKNVYRGVNLAGAWLLSEQHVISFTDRETAIKYACSTAEQSEPVENPRVYRCNVTITKPFVNCPAADVIKFEDLVRLVCVGNAFNMAAILSDVMQETPEWKAIQCELGGWFAYELVFQFRKYERYLFKLSVPLDALVHSYNCVQLLRNHGYDGAVYKHTFQGVSHVVTTVFDDDQIKDSSLPEYVY